MESSQSQSQDPRDDSRLRVYLIPQDKGKSRNYDYVAGTLTPDPDGEYSLFCRGRPTVVPFAIDVHNIPYSEDLKLKVQVVFSKIRTRVPVRCSNHKEGDHTVWRDQLMVSTDPLAQSLGYHEGNGFQIHPLPTRCDLLFLCRNSCRIGYERDWQLQFSVVDGKNDLIAVRLMNLRVCEVPHRDIMKSKIMFEWDPALSTPDSPQMKIMPCKEVMSKAEIISTQRPTTDVYPIYVSGYDSYHEIMQYVSIMEMRKKHEHPAICHAVDRMRIWTRETPILEMLQIVAGVEAPILLEKFYRRDVRTLGDLYRKYTPDYFMSAVNISPSHASNLNALYLNWRNIVEYYEMSVSKNKEDGL